MFALDETRPLACLAGIWTNWTSVRKVKEGETNNGLYAFHTTEPNAEVSAVHPKAMPVSHAALVLDSAGYHIAAALSIPENVTLVRLASYAPELNRRP